ncbi:FtsX-like permease family protein [Bacillus cereus]|uniref:ABC transporter permease n=1 Tax=Bacillus cereus TaxID=1396 RepID=UPI0002FEFBC8
MIGRMLKRDLLRNRMISFILFIFLMLSSVLIASAAGILVDLFGSMDRLFKNSNAPHFVQIHAGEIDQRAIDTFVFRNKLVKKQQTVEMITIHGSNVFINDRKHAENNSVMDMSFVKQNRSFDFLLDLENQVIDVSRGEVGVPIYYMKEKDLKIGDKIWIINDHFKMEFKIKAFVRDVQMNPSIVSSKRFVIHDADWNLLKSNLGESEYLIEFQLHDLEKVNEFQDMYQASNLPQKGTAITYSLFKTLNALSDGVVAVVIIFISLLLIVIALLCIRFTMITTMEEEYREIGVMKAIGIRSKDIQKLYLTKYFVLAVVASICGYILSLFIGELFTDNIALYMGAAEKTLVHYVVPLIGTTLVFIIVVFFCQFVLRKFRRISVVEAIRKGNLAGNVRNRRTFILYKSRLLHVNIFLGIKDVFSRMKIYSVLCFVFIISSFLMIVPVNFLNTMQSPDFVTYMGAGKSDIRIDLQQSSDVKERFNKMISYIQRDSDVEKHTALITSTFKVLNRDGAFQNMNVEIGDFTAFPLEYLKGGAPRYENEIALSYLNAKEMKKTIGDDLVLIVNGEKKELTICGIYQDVTNGGKTAKALLPYDVDQILWHVVNLDMKSDVDMERKIEEYKNVFYPAKVTDMDEYLSQTLGTTIEQLKFITVLAIGIAIVVSVLITSMFFKMLLAKDSSHIATLRSLGFSYKDIQVQYMTRSIFVLLIGIIVGTCMASTLGQGVISGLGSLMGASHIEFVVDPFVSYFICPLLFMIAVTVTTFINSTLIKNIRDLKQ